MLLSDGVEGAVLGGELVTGLPPSGDQDARPVKEGRRVLRAQEVKRVRRHTLHDSVGAVAELEPVDLPVAVRHVVYAIGGRRGKRHLRPFVAAENAVRLEAEEPVCAALIARGPQTQGWPRPHGAGSVGNRGVVVHLREGAKRQAAVQALADCRAQEDGA